MPWNNSMAQQRERDNELQQRYRHQYKGLAPAASIC
jgi:hypothetical protein